ncbi:MAG: alpha/beta hydrolase-fold protein [Anaerolineae bacterium]|jgi:enterochelin esterase-like enzyme
MSVPRGDRGDAARQRAVNRLLRGLGLIALAVLIALVVLVRPLPEPPSSDLAQGVEQSASVEGDEVSPTSAVRAVPTVSSTPSATQEPTPPPKPSPTATPTVAPTPVDTPTPVTPPTWTPTATPVAVQTADVQQVTSVPLAGRVEQHAYFSQVSGEEERYRIYLPPGYDGSDRQYPVLYLLHGWPYDETHWDSLGVDEVADSSIVSGALPPFVIVLPGADPNGLFVQTSGGAQSFEEQVVNELMPHIDATFRTVQTREARAIGGISRGGVWSLEIAFKHPDALGIVGAHSPALSANRAPSDYDPFSLVTHEGVGRLRIYLSAGDADWALEATSELHAALDQHGIGNQFVVHSGAHQDQLWAQHIGEYLAFYAAGW